MRLLFWFVQICVQGKAGRLFTLFLTSPVMGMAALVKLENADGLMLASCQVWLFSCTFHLKSITKGALALCTLRRLSFKLIN